MRGNLPPFALAFMLLQGSPLLANPWSALEDPTTGAPRSIGETSAGCLRGARLLPAEGAGYLVMHLERNRYYGHPTLIAAIRNLGLEISNKGLGLMHVGDLGMVRGGPMPYGHRSHQSGLDADIWFDLNPELHHSANADRSNIKAPSFVDPLRDSVDRTRWSEDQARMLKIAANLPDVDRIFVNARIKDQLCKDHPNERSWLRKIRPWYYHEDHFHMRLQCPKDSPSCLPQEPIPPGDGCDALGPWLRMPSEPTPERKKPQAAMPALPAECRAVLRE